MAAFDYVGLAADVRELVQEFGAPVLLEKMDATPVDANMPWKGPASPAVALSQAASGVRVPAQGNALGRDLLSPELLAKVDDVYLVEPVEGVDLEQFNAVSVDAKRYRVEWAQTLKPADVPLLYVFGVCR